MPAEARKGEFDTPAELEANVDEVIAECGGDSRAAVRTLLVANSLALAELSAIEAEMAKLLADVSRGYSRGNWEWLLERAEKPIPYSRG
jgi:hypothetical protein